MLNPTLHNRLKELFGQVRIANENMSATYDVQKDERGQSWGRIVNTGSEEYHVCCPYCNDTRFRLYLSYLYGQTKGDVRFGSGLVWCHNEEHCMEEWSNRKRLRDMIIPGLTGQDPVFNLTVIEKPSRPLVIPRNLIDLATLAPTHQAIQYLEKRRFTVDYARSREVQWCSVEPRIPLAEGRLFMPVRDQQGQLIGAQCRLPYDSPKKFPPKYYNLYGIKWVNFYNIREALAAKKDYVVVVEGIFDSWRLGGSIVALLGSAMAGREHILVSNWKKVIFVVDPGVSEQHYRNKYIAPLKPETSSCQTYVVALQDRDPADYEREELWKLIGEKTDLCL